VQLRRAVPGDERAVADVHVRAWQVGYRTLLPDDVLDGLRPDEWARRYTFAAGTGGPETTLAVDGGAVRGFATIGPSPDPDVPGGGELYALYVDPAWWGQGIGRGLIADAREALERRGWTAAHLWVLHGNRRAERFYTGDGWSPDGSERRAQVHGIDVDERRFRRGLP